MQNQYNKLRILECGMMDYKQALDLQEQVQLQRKRHEIPDTLIILEHPSVITLGRRGDYSNILLSREILEKQGIQIFEVTRGGDVTYHGPGQIVGYPVMDLNGMANDIKNYVWNIEEVFIKLLLAEFGLKADRGEKKYTGVWIGNEKITAIGIAVKEHITTHGFAFNVNTDLNHFKWINPCGITDKGVTSLEKITGSKQDIEQMKRLVIKYFSDVFGRSI